MTRIYTEQDRDHRRKGKRFGLEVRTGVKANSLRKQVTTFLTAHKINVKESSRKLTEICFFFKKNSDKLILKRAKEKPHKVILKGKNKEQNNIPIDGENIP